jgi:hypothetical protein
MVAADDTGEMIFEKMYELEIEIAVKRVDARDV